MPSTRSSRCGPVGRPAQPIGQHAQRVLRADRRDALHREREEFRQLRVGGESERARHVERRRAARRRTTPSTAGCDRRHPRRAPRSAVTTSQRWSARHALKRARQVQPHERRAVRLGELTRTGEPRPATAFLHATVRWTAQLRTYSLSCASSSRSSASVRPSVTCSAQSARSLRVTSGFSRRIRLSAACTAGSGPRSCRMRRACRTYQSLRLSCSSTSLLRRQLLEIDASPLVVDVADLEDPPERLLMKIGIAAVALVLVVPVDREHAAVRAIAEVEHLAPRVVGQQEVRAVRRGVAGALSLQPIGVGAAAVDVVHEDRVAVLAPARCRRRGRSSRRRARGRRRPNADRLLPACGPWRPTQCT